MHSDKFLEKSENSTHSQPFIRTRFNTIAAAQLDAKGRILEGAAFPEDSLIVKEMYDKTKTLKAYTTLYKNSTNKDADEKGWVWGAINVDGSVLITAFKKGDDCRGCHLQEGNIDLMLMNKYFQ